MSAFSNIGPVVDDILSRIKPQTIPEIRLQLEKQAGRSRWTSLNEHAVTLFELISQRRIDETQRDSVVQEVLWRATSKEVGYALKYFPWEVPTQPEPAGCMRRKVTLGYAHRDFGAIPHDMSL